MLYREPKESHPSIPHKLHAECSLLKGVELDSLNTEVPSVHMTGREFI
ncbi:hypothetical protein SLEP1_g42940 [Rubroshorea leprosula]|uniref:Uncharacterized protein n=1 Tax=Rubroshorea leprosula TaxID=152421 RepID=A0AAV5LBN8_9ROSI|nr:hypothetical protein SLEP1_g42940 [Rubroshorea leprosula]